MDNGDACAECNGPGYERQNSDDRDEDGYPLMTDGLAPPYLHWSCRGRGMPKAPDSLICGRCCKNTTRGSRLEKMCKCAGPT